MTTAKLTIDSLTKRYGSVTALAPTSLEVAAGEFLTLLGPSGSGKTTLLMMIAGLTSPSGGRIALDGKDITTKPPHARDIGVIFQNYALFPHLSVYENIAFPLRMRGRSGAEIDHAVRQALDLVQLPQVAARLPRELSGGQQQRIAFARAVVFRPPLVLMDEPLGALDKKLRDELKFEIRKLHRELGTTIVYVTHDQDEAMLLSNRICLMNNARIEQIGTPGELYERPATRFAATFIGESNLLDAISDGDGVRIGDLRFGTALPKRLPPAGALCSVLIRPERLRLGIAGPNSVTATVENVIDLGASRRLALRLSDDLRLSAITLGGGGPVFAGDTVQVSIDPADVVPLLGEAHP